MRKLKILLGLAILGGGTYLWYNDSPIKDAFSQYVENGEILTLEAKYSPEQLIENNRRLLLGDNQRTLKDSSLKYTPYLLMDVKYIQADKKTREGVVLWGMVDGEMVLNSDTWERSHGFEDAINAGATHQDFKIINILARSKSYLSKDEIRRELQLDSDVIDPWLDSARQKHLIVQKGNDIQLHFEDPRIPSIPQTKFKHWIVSKPYNYGQRVGKKYSRNQIEKISKAAFGQDFTIRSAKEVYLPIYSIEVANPDGSVMTSFWNALTGERINPSYLTTSP